MAARSARTRLTPERREQAAAAAAAQLLELPQMRVARRVLAYAPLAEELDPLRWLALWADAMGQRPAPQLVWPRVADRAQAALTLHACAQDELIPGSFGLREPRPEAPTVALADIDVVLAPGLAFDAAGYRIGYGKGYYDRLLELPPAGLITIGLCFAETFLEQVAHDEHDVAVMRVIVA